MRAGLTALLAAAAAVVAAQEIRRPPDPSPGRRPPRLTENAPVEAPLLLNDDAGWCWFQDERAIVVGETLVAGTVAAGRHDPQRRGAIEATGLDLKTRATTRFRLDATPIPGGYDDHNAPAFAVRGDGRLLAVFAGHGSENRIRHRVSSRPGDPEAWGDERSFAPSASSRVTYSNLHRLARERGRIYDFFRGKDDRFKPSVAWSDDEGETWTSGGLLIDVPAAVRHRPYAKYASDGVATVHVVYTEGHPRDFDNSLYHVAYSEGQLRRSDGSPVAALARGLARPEDGSLVFRGDAANVAWSADVEIDSAGRPYAAYSVQKDGAGIPYGKGGADHRYRLARWTGTRWEDSEIAHAGTRLYAGEDDYTGGIALVPGDPAVVFISTNADPRSGEPLVSRADGRRHWEIFRGEARDSGWRWRALTRDSTCDNIRPVVPRSGGLPIVLWLRGSYRAYTDYDLELVALLPPRAAASGR